MALAVEEKHNASLLEEEECEMDQLLDELYASNDEEEADDAENSSLYNGKNDEELQLHGGLENLGNTCYMASALQMLASATGFIESLQEEQDSSPMLRRATLDVIQRLWLGETIRPDPFKQVLDQRSPLFHGNRQQDSNELLVTLLDLLDEEYKSVRQDGQSPEVVKESSTCCTLNVTSESMLERPSDTIRKEIGQSSAEETNIATVARKNDYDASTRLPKATTTVDESISRGEDELGINGDIKTKEKEIGGDDDTVSVSTSATESTMSEQHSLSCEEETLRSDDSVTSSTIEVEATTKKARLSGPTEWLVKAKTSTPSSPPLQRPSFSSFTLSDIGRLLHGDSTDALILPDVSTTCLGNEPHYKLIGGRMNTSDVALKPFSEYETEAASSPILTSDSAATIEAVVEEATTAVDCAYSDTITTPIDSYFQTSVQIKLTCDSCHYTRRHTETFWQLSLEIGSDQHVEDALRRFFAPCQQELKCEKCFCDTATQTMELQELPPYLLLHFKRFIVDVSPDYSSVSYRKDSSPVYFQETLSLSDDYDDAEESSFGLESSAEYNLISVVHHIGSSASCGHYTADAKRNGVWTRFNDDLVDRITEAQAVDESSRHTAYMVLYQLDDIQR